MVRLPRPLPLAAALGLLLTACAAAGRATTATPPTPLGMAAWDPSCRKPLTALRPIARRRVECESAEAT